MSLEIVAVRDCWLGRGESVYATIRFYLLRDEQNQYCAAAARLPGVPRDAELPEVVLFGLPRATDGEAKADTDEFEGWLLGGVEWEEVTSE